MKLKFLILFVLGLVYSGFANSQICDVVYIVDVETADGQDVMTSRAVLYGLPFKDVEDNSKKGMRVVDLASKLQDRGGPYTVEMGETRSCDGKPAEKYIPNSIEVRGITLDGYNKLSRLTLQVTSEITSRYEHRASKGEKHGWDHKKAKKVHRDERGKKKVNYGD